MYLILFFLRFSLIPSLRTIALLSLLCTHCYSLHVYGTPASIQMTLTHTLHTLTHTHNYTRPHTMHSQLLTILVTVALYTITPPSSLCHHNIDTITNMSPQNQHHHHYVTTTSPPSSH